MTRRFLAFVLLLLLVTSCNDAPTTPPPTETPVTFSQTFQGNVAAGGAVSFSFSVPIAAPITVTLASVSSGGRPLSLPVTLGVGTPVEGGCNTTTTVSATPRLTSQISTSLAAGNYCANVADAGGITDGVDVVVRVTVNPQTAAATPGTDTWESTFTVKGSASRRFTAPVAGSVRVALVSVTPSPGGVGIGIGIPLSTGGCVLTQAVEAPADDRPSLSMQVDPGTFCVMIYDVGNLTTTVSFSLTVEHP